MNENKNSYFSLEIEKPRTFQNNEYFEDKLSDSIDNILAAMNVPTTETCNFKIKNIKNKDEIIYLFKTNGRKRKGQLNQYCERYFDPNWDLKFETKGLKRVEASTILKRMYEDKKYVVKTDSLSDQDEAYNGRDTKIFLDKKNWHSWQIKIFDKIFETKFQNEKNDINFKNFKESHDRKIIHLVDFRGNSGKSTFWKFIFANNEKDIARLTYATTAQLRSSVVKLGRKKLYIIDLPRTIGSDNKELDLLSVIEDIKSGLVINPMFGSGKHVLMEPPHIILSTNFLFSESGLSKDRWQIYEIKNNKLGKVNSLLRKQKAGKAVKK